MEGKWTLDFNGRALKAFLQSSNRFDEIVKLEPATGRIDRQSKSNDSSLRHERIAGRCAEVGSRFLALFVDKGHLCFQVDSKQIHIDPGTRVELVRGNEQNLFRLIEDGRSILELEYAPPKLDPPLELDPTPFVSEEDFDFLLFVFNVLGDPERRILFADAHNETPLSDSRPN